MSRLILSRDFKRTKTRSFLIYLWNKLAHSGVGQIIDMPSIGSMPIHSRQIMPKDAFLFSSEFYPLFHKKNNCLNEKGTLLFMIESDKESNQAMHKIMKERNLTLYDWDKVVDELQSTNFMPSW